MPSPTDYVRIFDTTLRDGEQSPGATLTSGQKLEVARALSRLGVDVIEAGFPAASPDDLLAVQRIAEIVGKGGVEGRPSSEPPIICGLARATHKDIEAAWQAVKPAKTPRIHTFLATSPIHREHKLRMSKSEVVARVKEMVAYARSFCEDIEFSPEDGGRTEPEFLWEVLTVAIAAGATTLNIPDTVGYTYPEEFGSLIAGIKKNVKGVDDVIISVHCHDDLGLATANSLAGVRNGARQVEVAVNGIGERAGNTALEEVVMALETRKAYFGFRTGIDTTQLARASKLVSLSTGIMVQPNKAIVGANAFAHESGIHQDGMLKHEETYEIMRPETVGQGRTKLVLGKHSGRAAVGARLRELGYHLDADALEKVFSRFKTVAEKKKAITDADLEVLVGSDVTESPSHYALDALQISCGTVGLSTATVRLRTASGDMVTKAAVGTGPVDAAFKAIDGVVRVPIELTEYSVQAVTEGIDALGEVSVKIRSTADTERMNPQNESHDTRSFHGHGADTDILVASTKAYLNAINRMLTATGATPRPASDPPASMQSSGETANA
jgi:2-isopropylmalate synthase